jgi:hypothetical protein
MGDLREKNMPFFGLKGFFWLHFFLCLEPLVSINLLNLYEENSTIYHDCVVTDRYVRRDGTGPHSLREGDFCGRWNSLARRQCRPERFHDRHRNGCRGELPVNRRRSAG